MGVLFEEHHRKNHNITLSMSMSVSIQLVLTHVYYALVDDKCLTCMLGPTMKAHVTIKLIQPFKVVSHCGAQIHK